MTRYTGPNAASGTDLLPSSDPGSTASLLARHRAAFKSKTVNLRDGAWEGVLAVEGRPTGDGREFARGSLTWPDPAATMLSLRWNVEESHGGAQRTTAVNVGRIDRVWRKGDEVWGEGVFDLRSPDGAEAARRVAQGFLSGVSVDVDDFKDSDIELTYPEDDGGILRTLHAEPEKIIFQQARVRGATLTNLPAFVEAQVWLKHLGRGNLAASAAFDLGGAMSALLRTRPRNVTADAWLRRNGWTTDRVRRGQEGLRDDLQGRVHPPPPPPLIAGGGPGGSGPPQSRPPLAVASPSAELVVQHADRALAAGTNPRVVRRWERQQLARLARGAS
jgi:hypothetical protein